jgi:hypothetical protein
MYFTENNLNNTTVYINSDLIWGEKECVYVCVRGCEWMHGCVGVLMCAISYKQLSCTLNDSSAANHLQNMYQNMYSKFLPMLHTPNKYAQLFSTCDALIHRAKNITKY